MIWIPSKKGEACLGTFDSEEEAAKMYARARHRCCWMRSKVVRSRGGSASIQCSKVGSRGGSASETTPGMKVHLTEPRRKAHAMPNFESDGVDASRWGTGRENVEKGKTPSGFTPVEGPVLTNNDSSARLIPPSDPNCGSGRIQSVRGTYSEPE